MQTFTVRGKTFLWLDDNTVLCPQDDKSYVSEGLEAMASEVMISSPRIAYLLLLKAEQERTGH